MPAKRPLVKPSASKKPPKKAAPERVPPYPPGELAQGNMDPPASAMPEPPVKKKKPGAVKKAG